jgi:hypothetical protein
VPFESGDILANVRPSTAIRKRLINMHEEQVLPIRAMKRPRLGAMHTRDYSNTAGLAVGWSNRPHALIGFGHEVLKQDILESGRS